MSTPRLAITVGDIAGIGPEIVAKALARASLYERSRPLVIGDAGAMLEALRFAPTLQLRVIEEARDARFEAGTIDLLQPGPDVLGVRPGELSPAAGAAAVRYVEAAVALVQARHVDAIVTAPLNKAAMHAAEIRYPGHTEILAELFGVERYSLVLTAQGRFVFHVTTHVSLRDALALITRDRVLDIVELAARFAAASGRGSEPIVVAGVNPHAGEGGVFGREEIDEIAPALDEARARGISVVGPLAADAMWPGAVDGPYRFLVAMYHDQGHAPFKSVYGDSGVNITVGLPAVRTSVDHGTAFDIAGRGIAREQSLLAAIELAIELAPTWSQV